MMWIRNKWADGFNEGQRVADKAADRQVDALLRALSDKDEVIEFLRVELAASREREGWYQQRFQEERDRSNSAADVLIQENGRRPLTHISDQILAARTEAAKVVERTVKEEDPFDTLPFGHEDGMYKTAEEAAEGYAGEV